MAFDEEEKPAYVFKICLIGSGAVGKTCIARRLCFDTFDANTQLTIGIDFYTYDIPILVRGEETFVRHTIWDFGGQEQFRKLFNYYIDGANGIFLVFDLSKIETLVKLDWWIEQLEEHKLKNRPKILIGTKLDIINSGEKKHKIDDLVIEQFLNKHDEKDFVKTSSKENINIKQSFEKMTIKILEAHGLVYDKLI
ncbi:MAG: Rab family GTPase [Candidatus Hermodarchaeota archaeon]